MPLTAQWLVPRVIVVVLGVAAATLVALACWRGARGTRVLLVVLVGYALVYGLSPQGGQPGAELQPRYLLFALPGLLLLLCGSLFFISAARVVAVGLALVVTTTVMSGEGIRRLDEAGATQPGGVPADISDLETLLFDRDVRFAYSFYWLAFRTTFETAERVIVTPAFFHVSRYEPYARAVRESENPAVIVFDRTPQVQAMESLFASRGIPSSTFRRGRFAVVIPERGLPREEITRAFQSVGVYA